MRVSGGLRLLTAVGFCLAALTALSAPAAADPVRDAAVDYLVLPGDTVSEIAYQFGIDVDTIVRSNSLRTADHIVPGQMLTILPVSGMMYTVRSGDTLGGIATRYDVEPDDVLRWNGIRDPHLVVIGSELLLPGAKPPPPPPPSAPAARPASAPPAAVAQARPATRDSLDTQISAGERSFSAKITAYAPGAGATGSTRSGTQVRWGVLAVDPRVVPLGSRVMIDGFEEVFIAEDTGGAIRGNHVEIFYPEYGPAIRFGVQTRRVTILD